MNERQQALASIIRDRQSIFPAQFTGDIIADEVITAILENAIHAPSHRKVNPWRFRVVSGEKRKAFGEFFQATYKRVTPEEKYSEKKYNDFMKKADASSHILVISMVENPERPLPEWENVAATACAVQNIYLSLTAAGLGGYWSTPGSMIKNISDFVAQEEHEKCLGFFFIGVPKAELPPKVDKGALENYVTWM